MFRPLSVVFAPVGQLEIEVGHMRIAEIQVADADSQHELSLSVELDLAGARVCLLVDGGRGKDDLLTGSLNAHAREENKEDCNKGDRCAPTCRRSIARISLVPQELSGGKQVERPDVAYHPLSNPRHLQMIFYYVNSNLMKLFTLIEKLGPMQTSKPKLFKS